MATVQGSAGARSPKRRRAALMGGALAICGTLATAYAIGASMHFSSQEQTARAIDQENVQFCAKLGLGPGSNAYVACIEGLGDVRRRHQQRLYAEHQGIL